MTKLSFCENNLSQGTDTVIDMLRPVLKNAKISVESCLGQCGECAMGLFAMVNDELVTADTTEELYERILEIVK